MAFTLIPTGKYVDFLVFLNTHSLPFIVNDPIQLGAALYEEIHNPLLTTSLLHSLGLSYIIKSIPVDERTKEFMNTVDNMNAIPPGDILRKCSGAFKHFCGSEFLSAGGKTNRNAAFKIVQSYINRHNLAAVNGWYTLDEELRCALNTGLVSVNENRLIELIEAVFT